jgi:HPt (histidine-containing phosphotransfer) domain-containing protein
MPAFNRMQTPPLIHAMSFLHLPIIDSEAINNLRSLGDEGDDTFLREIISIYLEDTPLRIADLKRSFQSGENALFTRSAHTIKGSSANVGASRVRGIAEQIEQRSKAEPITGLTGLIDELDAAFAEAAAALAKYQA